jgi:hypothetical protein
MKHTPRPWNFSQSPSTRKKLSGIGGFGRWYKSVKNTKSIGGKIIATAWGDTKEEAEANAKLIAAAPELLEACIEFCRKVECGEARSTRSYNQMQAAIKKATE